MDFELTEEQRIVQKNVRQFMVKEIKPLAEQINRDDKFPPAIWKKLGELVVLESLSLSNMADRDLIY